MNTFRALVLAIPLLVIPQQLCGWQQFIGDEPDGNDSRPVHLLRLFDEDSSAVRRYDDPHLPFSTRRTCGGCHDYARIAAGLHFNSTDSTAPGRPGEPWLLADDLTGTQVPLSWKGAPGSHDPRAFGLTPLPFLTRFGRHFPGGGIGENEGLQDRENFLRWQVSGALEINCLACHDASPGYDAAEFAAQTSRQNFRWAAAAASDFAEVTGAARDMPPNFDPYHSVPVDDARKRPPEIRYDWQRFTPDDKILFDIRRRVPDEKCAFCHSTAIAGTERWQQDQDVHLAAGLSCTDCHRNGIDHDMVRGFAGESESAERRSLTCAGCHLPGEHAGRFGAPQPEHAGLPPVHFEQLSCTACHSGPRPADRPSRVRTSRAHALGTRSAVKSDSLLPQIVAPVFLRAQDGRITPHKLIWPSYWAWQRGDSLQPLPPAQIRELAIFARRTDSTQALAGRLNNTVLLALLDTLQTQDSTATPVYLRDGRLYRSSAGRLFAEAHSAAAPYAWPVAHDVRPAAQALGARGCQECHSVSAPFFFSRVGPDDPQQAGAKMTAFMQVDHARNKLLALIFAFRPVLKWTIAGISALLVGVLLVSSGRSIAGYVQMIREVQDE